MVLAAAVPGIAAAAAPFRSLRVKNAILHLMTLEPPYASGLSARAISDLIRCTTLVPVLNSWAVLRTPLPLASAARIAAAFVASSSPTNRLPALGALLSRPGKPGVYPFPDDRALEFSKYTIRRGIFDRDTPGGYLRSYRASWITGIDKRTSAIKIDRAPTINIIFLLITGPTFANLQLFEFLPEFRQFRSQRRAIQRETAP